MKKFNFVRMSRHSKGPESEQSIPRLGSEDHKQARLARYATKK